ncbi:MAG TPA: NADP-dependent oxidoreductase [Candidatus Dormibacteraeota bacterium]|nr:NADP-dependent oxidoreductase [Candidatus Dormibacteraeota bacterium]
MNRQWLLARRPQGMVSADDFHLVEQPIPELSDGQVLVRNLYLSCDPAQRGWIGHDTYLPAVKLGDVMRSIAAGEVVESRHRRFESGQVVQGILGWQDFAVVNPDSSMLTPVLPGVPIDASLSVLGLNGLTAYFGLLEIGRPQPGETVAVSAAAGATGSAAGQIALIKGCRVVGIAGGSDKCRYVSELGFHAVIDYKAEDVSERLRETCPNGIDIYFDNVGGDMLNAALARLAMRGRVVLCGAIARYNDTAPSPGPSNYLSLAVQRGRMEGFIVLDYYDRASEAIPVLYGWMNEGKLKYRTDVVHGLENAPAALARLFNGENQGKQLVKIADPSGP